MSIWTNLASAAAAALLLTSCAMSAEDAVARSSQLSGTLLVGNKGEDSMSFVDLATGKEIARRDTGSQPHEIAISPDRKLAAIVAYGGETIDIFDIAAKEKVETVALTPNKRPHGIAWLDDGRIIATTEGSDSLTIVSPPTGDTQQREVSAISTGQQGSHMLAIMPDYSRVFVSNMQSGTVSVLDLEKMEKIADIPAGIEPEGLAVTPDGKTLWVADRRGDLMRVFDTESFAELTSIKTGSFPIRVVISPDGKTAASSNYGDGAVGLFDIASMSAKGEIKVSGNTDSRQVTLLFSPDGEYLYVAETGPDMIAEVSMESGEVLRRFNVGSDGDGLGIVLDQP